MRKLHILLFVATLLLLFSSFAASAEDAMKCNKGPAIVAIEKSAWNAYACEDGASLVLVTTPGNPAHPYYFLINRPPSDRHSIYGEGAGSKKAAKVAQNFVEHMTDADFDRIYADAIKVNP